MRPTKIKLITTFALLLISGHLQAATLTSSLSYITGDTWQYDYSLSTAAPLTAFTGFSVFFAAGTARNLNPVAAPAGWDILTIEPGSFIGDSDGFYDALSLDGLGAGEIAGLFSVQFDWGLAGEPMPQQEFEIYLLDPDDPFAFQSLGMGTTSVVPVPAAIWLFGTGILGLVAFARRRAAGA